jgi:hypothetical protein
MSYIDRLLKFTESPLARTDKTDKTPSQKLEVPPTQPPTKPTKPSSVSFVSDSEEDLPDIRSFLLEEGPPPWYVDPSGEVSRERPAEPAPIPAETEVDPYDAGVPAPSVRNPTVRDPAVGNLGQPRQQEGQSR